MKMPSLENLISEASDLLHLHDSSVASGEPAGLSAEEREELMLLHRVADGVQRVMVPVVPSTAFKAALRNRISDLARSSMRREVVVEQHSRPSEWMVGAIVGSAVALVGGLAYLIRVRSQTR